MKKMTILVISTLLVIMALPVAAVMSFTNLPELGWSALTSSGGYAYGEPITEGNAYDYGFCTYWAAQRRIEDGHPIPNHWGDAITWGINATLAGYRVDHIPEVGAIYQWPDAPGGQGHVAYVESVDPITGAWTTSEMNAVGWDVVNSHNYTAADALKYNFIHDKVITNAI